MLITAFKPKLTINSTIRSLSNILKENMCDRMIHQFTAIDSYEEVYWLIGREASVQTLGQTSIRNYEEYIFGNFFSADFQQIL